MGIGFKFAIGFDVLFTLNGKEYIGQIMDRREEEGQNLYTIYTNEGKKQCKEEELEIYYYDGNSIYVIQFEDEKFLEFDEKGNIHRVSLKNADKWQFKHHAEEQAKVINEKLRDKTRVREVELLLK